VASDEETGMSGLKAPRACELCLTSLLQKHRLMNTSHVTAWLIAQNGCCSLIAAPDSTTGSRCQALDVSQEGTDHGINGL